MVKSFVFGSCWLEIMDQGLRLDLIIRTWTSACLSILLSNVKRNRIT